METLAENNQFMGEMGYIDTVGRSVDRKQPQYSLVRDKHIKTYTFWSFFSPYTRFC